MFKKCIAGMVLECVLCFPEAVGTVEFLQGWKRAAGDLLGCGDDSMFCFYVLFYGFIVKHFGYLSVFVKGYTNK